MEEIAVIARVSGHVGLGDKGAAAGDQETRVDLLLSSLSHSPGAVRSQ